MQKIKEELEKLRKFFPYVLSKISNTIKSFSLIEKVVFNTVLIIFIVSSFLVLHKINQSFLVEIPTYGGSVTEGIIGPPRFINPVLATSNTDKDLCSLIYSGLLKADSHGELITDLAESYEISEDGFVYVFKIKDNLFFHDGHPITTEDIEFTINTTQNDIIKSPKRANWDGVEVKRLNDKEIQFILTQPYSPFLENLTIGILPKHIWGEISPEQFAFSHFNIMPIGSGPYKVDEIKRNSSEVLEKYTLKSFENYSLGEPYISKIYIKLYSDEETLLLKYKKNEVGNIASISPENIPTLEEKDGVQILSTPLPRIFGIFFNQDEAAVFTHKEVRSALNQAVDREQIVKDILNNYGVAINSPVPSKSKYYFNTEEPNEMEGSDSRIELAREILRGNGWEMNEEEGVWEKVTKKTTTLLTFSISTANTPELKAIANLLKTKWEEMGAKVNLKIFETGDLNQNVIRPRKYDSLLFGEVIGRDMDLFAFWHSSQRNDPGLNIAMYANITTDSLLEEIRVTTSEESKKEKFQSFQEEIANDKPAVFLYSPKFIYIVPKEIKNIWINQITIPSERFLDISEWYIRTDKVWKFFLNQ
ncbi:MAG: ABC transporter substrate-binding protein [Patescibacteria group bacterium]|nr:ABC transporter substrate-binding protein [Patescibacteria group bacterium]